jgi:AraC-like DNA-binding protein
VQRASTCSDQPGGAERFDQLRTELAQIGVSADPLPDYEGPFLGDIARRGQPSITHMTFNVQDSVVQRLGPQIRQVEWNQYLVYREFSPGAWFDYSGREFTTAPGDLVISDADTPFRTRATGAQYNHHAWLLPRHVLEPHLPRLPRPMVIHIPASSGVAALVVAYLDALSAQIDRLGEVEAGLVADNLGRLIAVACGGVAGDHREVVREARLDQARQYIDRRLASPDLDPESVAAALGVSVRQAHLIFEPSGESLSQYIRRRRLEECRAALQSPLAARRSVADIAFAWGFASLPTFYRAFSQAFGVAPGDIRALSHAS